MANLAEKLAAAANKAAPPTIIPTFTAMRLRRFANNKGVFIYPNEEGIFVPSNAEELAALEHYEAANMNYVERVGAVLDKKE